MEFKAYRHVVPTMVRVLTEPDYEQRKGTIQTLEGSRSFTPGDYLARNAKGEWPIKKATIEKKYIQVAPKNEEGFMAYMRLGSRLAAQMSEPFTIEGMSGKAGDYLVLGGNGGWPVDREIFEQTYVLAEEDNSKEPV
jgi:hypothetical protein